MALFKVFHLHNRNMAPFDMAVGGNAVMAAVIWDHPRAEPLRLEYAHVADVECPGAADVIDDLEHCFELTNNITHAWPENVGVKAVEGQHYFGKRFRSTSVGDILQEPSGRLWMVAGAGFTVVDRA